jgi:hypothetical protein
MEEQKDLSKPTDLETLFMSTSLQCRIKQEVEEDVAPLAKTRSLKRKAADSSQEIAATNKMPPIY